MKDIKDKIVKTDKLDDKVVFYFDINGADWKKYVDEQVNAAVKNVEIKGFRKGKAPVEQAKKHLDMSKLLVKASEKCIIDLMKEVEKSGELKKFDIELFYLPAADISEINEEKLLCNFTYSKIPEFTIDDYKKLKVDLQKPVVTDKEVEEEINYLLKKEIMMSPKTEGELKDGDEADFDFTGSVDGKEFAGGKAEHFKLIIGSKQFIPGFEEQMIGMKIGDERDINVTFPSDYHEKTLAGKNAIFKIKLHAMNNVEKPKLDDEFAKSLKFTNVSNVEELKKYLYDSILSFKKREVDQKNIIAINQAIVDATKYSNIPDILIRDEQERIHEEFLNQLSRMNIKEDDFLKMTRKTKDDLYGELKKQATNNIIVLGALRDIVKKENISVSDKEVDEAYEKIAKNYQTTVDEVKKMLPFDVLKENVLNEKTVDKLIEWNLK